MTHPEAFPPQPELAPRVLSQLLVLQGTLHVFRDVDRLSGFVERALEEIPGVARVQLLVSPREEKGDDATTLYLPLETSLNRFGSIQFHLDEPSRFSPYRSSVQNAANVIAVHLERQLREEELERLNRSLRLEIERKDAAERLLTEAKTKLDEVEQREMRTGPPQEAARVAQADSAAARLGEALMVPAALDTISSLVLEHVKTLTESAVGKAAVVENRPEGVVEIAAAQDLSGLPDGESFESLCTRFPEEWLRVLAGDGGAFANRSAAGEDGWTSAARRRFLAVPVLWGDRRPVGYIVAAEARRDYTPEDLALVERLAVLYSLAIRRQQELKEERRYAQRLEESQRLEAIGTLASGIAHEFRNLLQIIMGSTELLLGSNAGKRAAPPEVDAIRTAADRGASLTRKLLTFARRPEPARGTFDLNRTVRRVAEMLRPTIPRAVDIELRLANDVGLCRGDSGQIEQVLVNLALNARDAMPEGGCLTLATERRPEEPDTSRIVVADTGTGIGPEEKERIFEPFFTTKSPGKGTGLGLAVAYGIVTAHGGRLECSSEPGGGAVFTFALPHVSEKPASNDALEHLPGPENATGETVLIVDDERSIRHLVRTGLGARGYTVLEASSGEEALEVVRGSKASVDLVVLDLGMAGIGGRECLTQLRRIAPRLKVLVATGYAVSNGEAEGIEGASGVLGKPFRLDELAARVRTMLDQ